jgi:ankyrin repeat protein
VCAQALIDAGADVDAVSGQNLTAMVLAAAHGCGECVAALARAGADGEGVGGWVGGWVRNSSGAC